MKKIFVLCTALLLAASAAFAEKGTIFLYGPELFQVMDVSPNGKWACGYVGDNSTILRAVRWDLTTGEVLYLSGANDESYAAGVTNDGMVVGTFSLNGIGYQGQWKNGKWTAFDNSTIEGASNEAGDVSAVTPDGRYAVGALYINGTYTPVKWENGILALAYDSPQGAAYCISDDGKIAAGWSWETPMSTDDNETDENDKEANKNRVSTYWDENNVKHVIGTTGSPWSSINSISPDGKKMIVGEWGFPTVFNKDTQTRKEIALAGDINNLTNTGYFFINDNGVVFGYEAAQDFTTGYSGQYAIVYESESDKAYKMVDWLLEKKNVQIESEKVDLMRAAQMSADEKVITALTIPLKDGQIIGVTSSMAILLDREITNPAPVVLKANKLHGINNVFLSWNEPLANAEAVVGYNLYRNGEKITPDPIGEKSYMDVLAQEGTYTYAVTAIYDDENLTESEKSESVTIDVVTEAPNMVRNLDSYAIGYNDLKFRWDAPVSNLPEASYFDTSYETAGFGGGSTSFITAIRINEEFIKTYAEEFCIARVSFIPRNLNAGFSIKIYADDEEVYAQKLDSKDLTYNKVNIITLDTPFRFTANQKIYVGIEVDATYLTTQDVDVVGMSYGTCTPGYSDLVRQTSEPAFYSLHEDAIEQGQGEYPVSWSISALFAKVDANGKALIDSDIIENYDFYRDGEKLATVTEQVYTDKNVATGVHTYSVVANFADKRSSEQAIIKVEMQPNEKVYKPITNVSVIGEPTFIEASWQTPLNNDETFISYAGDVVGSDQPSFSNSDGGLLAYSVAAEYDSDYLSWYEGYQINSVRFFPTDEAAFAFIIEEDDNILDVIEIGELGEENGYTLNQWNEYSLTSPITIKSGSTYRLTLVLESVVPGTTPICLDNQMGRPNYGDLFKYDGSTYWTYIFAEINYRGSWMIGMNTSNGNTEAMPIEGYNVYLDNNLINTELLTTPYIKHAKNSIQGTDHRLKVNVVYPVYGEVEGDLVFFTIAPAAVESVAIDRVKVYPNPASSFIRVEGDVESLELFDLSGRKVAESATAEMDVTAMPTGNYLLKVKAAGEEKNVKVVIVR